MAALSELELPVVAAPSARFDNGASMIVLTAIIGQSVAGRLSRQSGVQEKQETAFGWAWLRPVTVKIWPGRSADRKAAMSVMGMIGNADLIGKNANSTTFPALPRRLAVL
jgi:hypothetical protein